MTVHVDELDDKSSISLQLEFDENECLEDGLGLCELQKEGVAFDVESFFWLVGMGLGSLSETGLEWYGGISEVVASDNVMYLLLFCWLTEDVSEFVGDVCCPCASFNLWQALEDVSEQVGDVCCLCLSSGWLQVTIEFSG